MNAKLRVLGTLWSPLVFASTLLAFLNTYVLIFTSLNRECASNVQKSAPTNNIDFDNFVPQYKDNEDHWDIQEKDDKYRITFEGDFNWEEEYLRLMSVLPLLRYDVNNYHKNNHSTFRILYPKNIMWYKMEAVSRILPKIPKKLRESKITEKIKLLSSKSFPNHIYNCQELSALEKSKGFPKLTYYSRSATKWRGTFISSESKEVKVVQKRYSIVSNSNKFVGGEEGENGEFELAKRELFNLLSVQSWYGMPRLYAVCAINDKFQDIGDKMFNNMQADQLHMIRFVVTDYDNDNSVPFCVDGNPIDECVKVRKLYYRLRSLERPAVAAIQVMLNIATLFHNIYIERACVDGISGHQIVMTENFEITITDVSSLIFLSVDEQNLCANYSRLLSGTICKHDRDCPAPTWYTTTFGSAVSASCGEIKGMCSTVGLCYGVDIHAYVCVFSRWVFSALSNLIPYNWEDRIELIQLLKCGSDPFPEKRCSWKQLKDGFQALLQNATKKWPEEPSNETDR